MSFHILKIFGSWLKVLIAFFFKLRGRRVTVFYNVFDMFPIKFYYWWTMDPFVKQGRWGPGWGSCTMSLNHRGLVLKTGGSSFLCSAFNAAYVGWKMHRLTEHFLWQLTPKSQVAEVINSKTCQSMDFSINDGCLLSGEPNRCVHCFLVVDLLGEIGV